MEPRWGIRMRLCVLGVNYGNGLWTVVAHAALRVKLPYAQRIILWWCMRKMCRFAGFVIHGGCGCHELAITMTLLTVSMSE